MKREEILSHVDHTLLKAEATWPQIQKLIEEAAANHVASICINSGYVAEAAQYIRENNLDVRICTVVGFPLGAMSTAAKVFEATQAVADGAVEVDMVIAIGRLKNGEVGFVRNEIAAIKKAIGSCILKVIIETCLLTQAEKEQMCEVVCEAGADYIKTSTGFSTAGATFEDIELFVRCVHGRCKVKAAGGIHSVADMEKFIELGADRLGSSSALKYLDAQEVGKGEY